jgi:alpha-glucosidase
MPCLHSKFLLALAVIVLAAVLPRDARAAFINSLNYSSYALNGSDVTIHTSGSGALKITVAYPDVARVWVAPSGSFTKDPSYAVDPESWALVPFTVNDKGSYLQILTSAMSIRVNKTPLGLSFYDADDATPVLEERTSGGVGLDQAAAYWTFNSDEHIFGAGGDNDICGGALDRRSTTRNLHTGMVLNTNCGPAANIPVSFFMSSGHSGNGYGLFYDNFYQGTLDFGVSSAQVQSWTAQGGTNVFYFFNGPSFKSILDRYTQITGRPQMPPLWTLGYLQSKVWYTSWSDVHSTLDPIRAAQIPIDAMILDMPWMDCYMDYQWSNTSSPADSSAGFGGKANAASELASLKAAGTHVMIINDPMIESSCSSTHASAASNGLLANCGGGYCSAGWYMGDLVDPTAPAMQTWLWDQSRVGGLYADGVAAWWLDLSEPDQEPSNATYAGGPAAKVHNAFVNLWAKIYHDGQLAQNADDRVFILTRTGVAGVQKYGAAVWTGDIYPTYNVLTAHVPESQSVGLSGIPWWSQDTGGYQSPCYKNDCSPGGAQALLYQRWMEFSAFVPVMRAHGNNPDTPLSFGSGVQAVTSKYIALRYRLLPYIYSYAWQANQTGAPIQRALAFEYQDDTTGYGQSGEYLFGQELLIAPVTAEATTTKQVYFPEGTWFDYDTGTAYAGKSSATVSAPLDTIPVFVKSGSIIPMAPAMTYTGQKPWDPITLDVYPDGDSAFTLYEDDGHSLQYQSGNFTTTQISAHDVASQSLFLTLVESSKSFSPKTWEFSIHLPAQTTTPAPIQFDGQDVPALTSQTAYTSGLAGSWWDSTNKVLWVKGQASSSLTETLSVSLDGNPVPIPDAGASSDAGASGADSSTTASNDAGRESDATSGDARATTSATDAASDAVSTSGTSGSSTGSASGNASASAGCSCSSVFSRPQPKGLLFSAALGIGLLVARKKGRSRRRRARRSPEKTTSSIATGD